MATLALDIFVILLCIALGGVGSLGMFLHKRGVSFPLSPKMCQHVLTAGAFIGLWIIMRPTP